MSHLGNKLTGFTLAIVASTGCLFVSEKLSLQDPSSFVTQARAIIGRPLTPLSYAGVARRTTRRDIYAGAAVYGGAAAAVAVRPACAQVVNAYGRIVTVCR
jgi:hypothetical protein